MENLSVDGDDGKMAADSQAGVQIGICRVGIPERKSGIMRAVKRTKAAPVGVFPLVHFRNSVFVLGIFLTWRLSGLRLLGVVQFGMFARGVDLGGSEAPISGKLEMRH